MPWVVCNLRKKLQGTGSIDRNPGQGPPRATTARKDRQLSIIARHNTGATASQLSRYLCADTGTCVSRVTVSKRLHEKHLLFVPTHVYGQESPFSMVQKS
ncbi:HTH_Tnp_Tc3_2 domain-containing protein [Trichonephila clavipes]|nr:HTH_Tnp_Tc3_2 domain-containing protein [Trichonephila clavipes]